MHKLLLIDGNAIMHRAYHAIPPFKTKSGIQTNAIFGFFSILNKAVSDYQPDHLIVCFDTPVPTFRKKLFKEYQSHRPKIEDELSHQFTPVKTGLDQAQVTHIEKEGFEADDVIGTIAKKFGDNNNRVLILSGDRDILQLVDKNIFVITPQLGFNKEKIYDKKAVIEKFGISPEQIPDFKALMGDASDNYKGAKGIGPKTAAKLLQQYQSVDNVLDKLEKIDGKIQQMLKDHAESVRMSHQLATILTDVKLDINLEKTNFKGFDVGLKEFFKQYEIYSLINRFFPKEKAAVKVIVEKKKDADQIGLF
jgi:5'-3' exonuclease